MLRDRPGAPAFQSGIGGTGFPVGHWWDRLSSRLLWDRLSSRSLWDRLSSRSLEFGTLGPIVGDSGIVTG